MRLRPEALLAGALIATGAAAETTFEPRVSVSENYVSNVTLAPSDLEQDDWVTELKPGFKLKRTGSRFEFDLDYDLQGLYYADNGDYNDAFSQLAGTGTAELIQKRFFIDLDASYNQYNADPFGRVATSNLFRTGNRTDVGRWQASPWWQQPLGDAAEATLRYTVGQSDFKNNENDASNLEDSDVQRFDFALGTPLEAEGWTWGVDYLYTRVDYETAPEYEYERTGGELGIPVGSKSHLLFGAGLESDLYESSTDAGLDTEWWNVGWRWSPTARQTLEARVGDRFWGNDYQFSWKRKGSLGNLELAYAEAPGTFGALDFGAAQGPADGWFGQGSIDDRIYLSKNLSGTATWKTARSDFNVQLYWDQRDYVGGTAPDDSFTKDEEYAGVRAGWQWQAFTRTRLDFDVWWESREYAQGDGDLTQVTFAVVRQITPQLEARFEVAHLENDTGAGTLADYEANTGFLGLTWRR